MAKQYQITRGKFFDTGEQKKILQTTKRKANEDRQAKRQTWIKRYMLVHLAMYSGLRVAEIANLKIHDLKLRVKDPYIKVTNGKGGKDRNVYIDHKLTDYLIKYTKHRRKTEPLFACTFDTKKPKHYTTNTLYRSFKKAVRAANLRDELTIHSARHTYATLLLEKTGNLRYVQKQLGHSKIEITALYADILPEKNSELANMILD